MERINILKKAIINVYEDYATYLRGLNYSSVEYQVIADDKNHHYQLVAVGWENDKRIFYVIFQADIIFQNIPHHSVQLFNLFFLFFNDFNKLFLAHYHQFLFFSHDVSNFKC